MIKFDKNTLGRLHDVIFDSTNIDIKKDEDIISCYNKLPDHIKNDVVKYGIHDTPTRDKMFIWFQENLKINMV
jgi:hypothetical protein